MRGINPFFTDPTKVPKSTYQDKRGKFVPGASKATWGSVGGDGQPHDPKAGEKVLDEALGSGGDSQ
jgi:hypothetical protein